MVLNIINLTGSNLTYLSGAITVGPFATYIVPIQYHFRLANDGQLRLDCNSNALVSDGVTNYAAQDAITFLNRIPGLKDAIGQGLTSTTIGPKQALDVNIAASDVVINTDSAYAEFGLINFYQISSIGSGISTSIGIYTVPGGKTAFLQQVMVSGTNVAQYDVFVNSSNISRKRTIYTELNEDFLYAITSNNGYKLIPGDQVEVKVIHNRPFLGDFNATIEVVEK